MAEIQDLVQIIPLFRDVFYRQKHTKMDASMIGSQEEKTIGNLIYIFLYFIF